MISVIIPLYNTATLLPQCVESLLSQDYEGDWELIIVDDGSTDGSLEVARRYEGGRVRVLAKANGGPADARNYGLDHCSERSEWVTFVDSDDYVEPSYLSTLDSLEGDLRICAMYHHEGASVRPHDVPSGPAVYGGLSASPEFASLFPTGLMGPFWNKLFSLSIIRANGLRIKNVRILEDVDFVFRYTRLCSTASFTPAPLYHYVHRPGSETSQASSQMLDDYMGLHGEMLQWFAPGLERVVHEFAYPQYLALLLRLIRRGDYAMARRYLSKAPIRRAMRAHRPASRGEKALIILLLLRLPRLASRLVR